MGQKRKASTQPPATQPAHVNANRKTIFGILRPFWPLAVIVAAGLFAYSNSFQGKFVFDDHDRILDNPGVRQLWPLSESIFAPDNVTRPLVTLTLIFNTYFNGRNVWGWHAFNLGIHLLAGMVLFGLIRQTLRRASSPTRPIPDDTFAKANAIALGATLLWLVHPLQTESVTYIIQRAEAMLGLFYLLTVYCAVRGFASPKHAGRWYLASILACIMGAGCKQSIVTAPLVVLAYDHIFNAGTISAKLRQHWRLYAGLASSGLIVCGLLLLSGPILSAGYHLTKLTPLTYLLNQGPVITHYLRLCLYPQPLCLDYDWPIVQSATLLLPGLATVGLLLILTCYAFKRSLL